MSYDKHDVLKMFFYCVKIPFIYVTQCELKMFASERKEILHVSKVGSLITKDVALIWLPV